MKCKGTTVFNAKTVHCLFFYTYLDNSIMITFNTLSKSHNSDYGYRPFLTPTIPAYEVPMIGSPPVNTVFLRNDGRYQDSILVLLDEGVIVADSIRDIGKDIVCAELTSSIYTEYVAQYHKVV